MKRLVGAIGGPSTDATTSRYAHLRKLDSSIQELARDRFEHRKPPHATTEGLSIKLDDRVLVDVYVKGDMRPAARALRDLGMQVTSVSRRSPEHMVEGWLSPSAATEAAGLDAVGAVLPVAGGGTDTGSTLSQGDAKHNGPAARSLGTTGSGVNVGVISDTINKLGGGVAASQASGDLPADVQVLSEPASGDDEGRAMAEIVYDEAPGIPQILFSSGHGGAASKASAIDNLVSQGARVIADDTYYLSEPMFQDGTIAQAVDRARAAGTAYLASAGNRARQSWEGTFSPGAGSYNDFDPGAGQDTEQAVVSIPGDETLFIALQWAEPWGGATTDLDLEAYDITNGNALVASSTTDNITTGIPRESLTIANSGSAATFGIKIKRVAGTGTPRMKYIANSSFGAFTIAEHDTSSATINPDAASASGSLAVAAVRWSQSGLNVPESFSSRGPVTRLFDANGNALASPDARQKPNVAGADGVSTSVTGFTSFFGTSAAAPSVAGIAALLRSANPTMPVSELYAILTNSANAIDCTAAGNPDADCGAGFSLADDAVTQALDGTPPDVAASVTPSTPDGQNGWYRGSVDVSWGETDGDSPVVDVGGCDPATVSTNGTFTFSCRATSAGGTTTVPLTIRRDASPPTTPKFTGIAARDYDRSDLPAQSAIGCTSTDSASGVTSCRVSGYGSTVGTHVLTATATNGAGLRSAKTLTYLVSPGAAIRRLKLSRVKLSKFLRSGAPISFTATGNHTRIVVSVKADLPSASAGRTRTITVGKLTKTIHRGVARLVVKSTAKGKRQLKRAKRVKLRVRVAGTAPGRSRATLNATLRLQR